MTWNIHLKVTVGEFRERLAAEIQKQPFEDRKGRYRVTLKKSGQGHELRIRVVGIYNTEFGLTGRLEEAPDQTPILRLNPYTNLTTKLLYFAAPVTFFLASLLFYFDEPLFRIACVLSPLMAVFAALEIHHTQQKIFKRVKKVAV